MIESCLFCAISVAMKYIYILQFMLEDCLVISINNGGVVLQNCMCAESSTSNLYVYRGRGGGRTYPLSHGFNLMLVCPGKTDVGNATSNHGLA